jgi:Ca2+-dependent lipid-binding protein
MYVSMAAIGSFVFGSAVTFAISKYYGSQTTKKEEESTAVASRSLNVSSDVTSPSNNTEQINFLSDLLRALWPELDVAVSDMIKSSCEEVFATLTPKIKVTKMQLGTVPIRMDNIHIERNTSDKSIRMTMDVVWNGNCDMEFQTILVGFGVEHLKFQGRLVCTLFPLTQEMPLVGAVQYAFCNPPTIQMKFTGVASVADFTVLQDTVQATIASSLSSLVLPNKSLYKMDPKFSVKDIYQPPMGILRITVVSGASFQVEKRRVGKNDVPDVYVKVLFGVDSVHQTSVVKDSLTPAWNDEYFDVVLYDTDQILTLQAWDEDTGRLDSDDDLGQAQISIRDVLYSTRNRTCTLDLQNAKDHRLTGANLTVACEILPLEENAKAINAIVKPPTSYPLAGLLTVLVQGATNLPVSKKEEASSFVKVKIGNAPERVTATIVDYPGIDALNPTYEAMMDIPLTFDLVGQDIILELWNGTTPILLGSATVQWDNLLQKPTLHTTQSIGDDATCTLEFSVLLRSVTPPLNTTNVPALAEEDQGNTTKTTTDLESMGSPTGTENLTLTAVSGRGFPIQRRRMKKADIPDIYLQLTVGTNPTVWRTPTIKNSEDPTWKVAHDFTIPPSTSAASQTITIQSFDEDKGRRDSDDPQGQARVNVGHVLTSAGGQLEVELHDETNGQPLGRYVTLACRVRGA